ncbi:MAG TPA: MFS transporter [Anaerolineae bacterium]|nr:MFS transporter [Anaerolineae bacterium]
MPNPKQWLRSLQPQPTLTEDESERARRLFIWEGAATMGLGSIIGGGFLAAYALALGANTFQIGILAALPSLMMPLQIFSVALVEKIRRRKLIATPAWIIAQLIWFPIALIPVLVDVPSAGAISLLLSFIGLRAVLVASQNAAWNGILRDLVPQSVRGTVFATRLRYASLASMVFGLGAALFVDFWRNRTDPADEVLGYTFAILAGAIFLGLTSSFLRWAIPEPAMQPPVGERSSLGKTITEPFKDPNFRPLIRFMFLWSFTLNLAVPFFSVYMLTRIGLPVSAVVGLSVLSQGVNVVFLRLWGPMVDRLGNKAVLSTSASLYLTVILGWTFTTMPERYFLTIPLLLMLHILAGAAAAGTNITTGTFGMKLAPDGKSTGYLSAVSISASAGAAIAPLLGGAMVDFFAVRSLSLDFTWIDPDRTVDLPAINLTGFDFLFGIAFLIGLFTIQQLNSLREEGEVSRSAVIAELLDPARRATSPMSSVPGISFMTHMPLSYASHVPGLDAVLGVTAYQVAEASRLATRSAAIGARRSEEGVRAVSRATQELWTAAESTQHQTVEFARQSARGVTLAAESALEEAGRLTRFAVKGVFNALHLRGSAGSHELLAGATYGAVQGAIETGATPEEISDAAIAAAKEIAAERGLPEQDAVDTARAAMDQAVADSAGKSGAGEPETRDPEDSAGGQERSS